MNNLSYNEKLNLLAAVRIRFTPELDLPRDTAIQKIVERAIYVLTSESILNVSMTNIRDYLHNTANINIHKAEVSKALKKLISNKAGIIFEVPKFETKYSLTEKNKSSIKSELQQSTQLFEKVSTRLFSDYFDNNDLILVRKYFLEFLSKLFALFGNQWVKFQNSEIKSEEFIDHKRVNSIADKLFSNYSFDEQQISVIKNRIFDFFRASDPEYDQIKFNFGQSYYITQLLGYQSKVDLFSKSVFAGSDMWLDTNVVLVALLIGSRHFKTFHTVAKLSKKLGINFYISRKTILETLAVYTREKEMLEKLYNEIPDEYLKTHTCSNSFLETYRILKNENDSDKNIEDLYNKFDTLENSLSAFGIGIIDNYDKMNEYSKELPRLIPLFQKGSNEERNLAKTESALEHDALHYLLVLEEKKYGKNVWFLTLDKSLSIVPTYLSNDGTPYCVLLDNLLQAISPYIDSEDDTKDFAAVFSEMIASQVLPKEQLFDLKDFLVFSEVGISCKSFSSEEIDDILTKVKRDILKGLNPYYLTEEKRKEITYWFEKYYADHKTKQTAIINEKETEIDELKAEISDAIKQNKELEKQNLVLLDQFIKQKKISKSSIISGLLLIAIAIICYIFAKLSVENWNGYLFYISDFSWGSYLLGLFVWLLIIRFILGKDYFQTLLNFIKDLKNLRD